MRVARPAITALILAGLMVSLASTPTAGEDIKDLIDQIEQRTADIEAALARTGGTDKNYGTPEGFGELLTWQLEGRIVKMVDTIDSDGASRRDTYYFSEDGLILVSRDFKPYQLFPDQRLTDLEQRNDRMYYHRGRMIRMRTTLVRETDPRDQAFEESEEEIGRTARDLLRFAASDYDDLPAFLSDQPVSQDWDFLGPSGPVSALPGPVQGFLDKLSTVVSDHHWEELLTRAHPGHYRSQVMDLRMEEDQYIRELLGLYGPRASIDRADRIGTIEFKRWNVMGKRLVVEGVATTSDGRKLPVRIELLRRFDGIYLTGAVG